MKLIRFLSALTMGAGICIATSGIASEYDAEGFDCSFKISEATQSIRGFELTARVYECLRYSGHRDLTVVNANNQIVPLRVVGPSRKVDVKTESKTIPFYHEPAANSYKTGQQIKRISSLTGIESGQESAAQWQSKNNYYSSLILQQQELNSILKKITLKMSVSDTPISATVIIEQSNDLTNWTTVRNPINVLYLPGESEVLQNNEIDLSVVGETKYLRLATLSNIEGFVGTIKSIVGTYESSISNQTALQWFSADLIGSLEDKSEWFMKLPGLQPVSQLQFIPAERVAFYKGALYSKKHTDPDDEILDEQRQRSAKKKLKTLIKNTLHDPHVLRSSDSEQWQYKSGFTQYKIITGDDTATSANVEIPPAQSKLWKVIFSQPQIVDKSQLPKIKIGWRPSKITFVAQGSGPFRLLAGNTEIPTRQHLPEELLALNNDIETVALLLATQQSNDTSVSAVSDDVSASYNLSEILLWLILLVGVLIMVGMAYQLSKKMKIG